ncbi:MAG: hypothetical protein R6U94_10605 [Nitriliruptoraceae bacterium]
MGTDALRVVVVSREPVRVTTLLRSKLPDCSPVSVTSVEDVPAKLRPDAIVLLDLGEGGTSLDAARRLRADGIRHGIVVIGPSATGGLAGVGGLQPPFQLSDLVAAMEQAREHSARSTSTAGPETALGSAEHDPTIRPAEPRHKGEDASAPEPPPPQVREQPQTLPPVRRTPSPAVPQVAREAARSADESLSTGRSPAHPSGTSSHGRGVTEPLRSAVGRWRRRLSVSAAEESSEPSEEELQERLVRIFAATSQIESIAGELPVITDRAALYEAIVMTIADEFTADSVVLWRRAQNGWLAAAHRGLTGRGASLPVGSDQPVLHDVDAQMGAVLLHPTASFQHLVAGIGGAHTESFMASSVAVGSNRMGVLTVGRDEPLGEPDLDRLAEMAVEAAIGIGVAEHIQRMASLVGRKAGGEPTQGTEPGRWREEFLGELEEAWKTRRQGGQAAEPAVAAGMWSTLETQGDADAVEDEEGSDAAAHEQETVIDLTDRTTDHV